MGQLTITEFMTLDGAGLVDVFRLWQYPVVLGTGKRLFADGALPTALRLTESVTYPSGALQLTYETAGAPTFADMTERS